jgi:hypothetical protein
VSATGLAEAGVMARGEAETNLQLGDGLVAGHAEAQAESGAGGKAKAHAGVSFNPPEAVVNAKAEAFAGARAGYSAKGGVAGVGYGIEAEVWAGAGAKAEINGGLDKDGKFKVEFSLGIACGVGAMVKINFEFDTKNFGKVVTGVVKAAGDVIGAIVGAVAGLFDGGSGDGKHAGQVVASAIKSVAPLIAQAATTAAKNEIDQQRAAANDKPKAHEASSGEHDRKPKPSISTSSRKGTLIEGDLS